MVHDLHRKVPFDARYMTTMSFDHKNEWLPNSTASYTMHGTSLFITINLSKADISSIAWLYRGLRTVQRVHRNRRFLGPSLLPSLSHHVVRSGRPCQRSESSGEELDWVLGMVGWLVVTGSDREPC